MVCDLSGLDEQRVVRSSPWPTKPQGTFHGQITKLWVQVEGKEGQGKDNYK